MLLRITFEQLETALNAFRGVITQIPPMYSAVKHQGKPLYELARAGIDVERKSRTAKIYSLEIKDWKNPILTIEVTCGKGTYIRSLANDLGQALGCGAILKNLERSRCGIFDINEAVTPEHFEEACRGGYWESLLYPMDSILSLWETVIVGEEKAQAIRNGALDKSCRKYVKKSREAIIAAPIPGTGACWGYCVLILKKNNGNRRKYLTSLTPQVVCVTNNSRAS